MKRSIFVAAFLFVVTACTIAHPTVPAGYRTCYNDADCGRHEYCGFKEIDTYAVCLKKAHEIHWVTQ